jgi:hypothetical protein
VLALLVAVICSRDDPVGWPGDGGGLAAARRPGMLCGMQEIARFLATHPPFDGLPPEALEQTAATVEIAYFPRGSSILRQNREPSRYLHVIVKGVVELRQADDRGASELVETLAEARRSGTETPIGSDAPQRVQWLGRRLGKYL